MKDRKKETLFVSMFNDNRAKIYRLCYAYLNDKSEIDDLFQEIMINVWNSLDKFRGDSKVSTWIYRIAINTAFLFNKKTSKKKDLFSNSLVENLSLKDESPNDTELNNRTKLLHQCISKLEKQDRIIISLILEGLKYDEVSEICGLKSNHVGVRINRIKAQLFKLMKEVQNG